MLHIEEHESLGFFLAELLYVKNLKISENLFYEWWTELDEENQLVTGCDMALRSIKTVWVRYLSFRCLVIAGHRYTAPHSAAPPWTHPSYILQTVMLSWPTPSALLRYDKPQYWLVTIRSLSNSDTSSKHFMPLYLLHQSNFSQSKNVHIQFVFKKIAEQFLYLNSL